VGTGVRHDPGGSFYLLACRGVLARSEDREGAEEGGVRLLEEVAEGGHGFF
jgi:hypothetical protein